MDITQEKLQQMLQDDFARPVDGFPYYYVTRNGRVISTIIHNGINIKYMTPQKEKHGYIRYFLRDRSNKKTYGVLAHRLVAQAFVINPNKYNEVNHIDENKKNNDESNLEWCSRLYNIMYGTGINRRAMKAINGKQSKKVGQYSKDGVLLKVWESAMECGRNNFGQGNVTNCCNGKLATYKGFIWKYLTGKSRVKEVRL